MNAINLEDPDQFIERGFDFLVKLKQKECEFPKKYILLQLESIRITLERWLQGADRQMQDAFVVVSRIRHATENQEDLMMDAKPGTYRKTFSAEHIKQFEMNPMLAKRYADITVYLEEIWLKNEKT